MTKINLIENEFHYHQELHLRRTLTRGPSFMTQSFLTAIDHIEIYVFNAFQAANFYRSVFGFDIIAYAGPETGLKDQISYFLRQGSIRLVISSSLNRDSLLLKHVINHDESVKDIA
jgi:4-hydroxyphenylpyruvate dioxygenase